MSEKRTVLVTGISTGIGHAIANLLATKDLQVFGTSRKPDKVSIPNVTVLPMDVDSDESVQAGVASVLKQAGQIDVLINNAGFLVAGAVEEVTMAQARQQFETNFFGTLRTVQAVLPHMRQRRSGRIINIGSLTGLLAMPFWSVYDASKFAIEGFTEALRDEVKHFNIHVSLIEPGHVNGHESGFEQNAQLGSNRIDAYNTMRERVFAKIRQDEDAGPKSAEVAALVWKVMEQKRPRLRNMIGNQVIYCRLKNWMPESTFESAHRTYYNLDGKE